MRIIEILYQIIGLGSSFLGLDLVGRDNSGELLGLRSNISIQEVVYLNFKRRLKSWNIQVYVLLGTFQLRG